MALAKTKLPLGGVGFRKRQAIIATVKQSVRKLVQEAVDGIRRFPDVWRRVFMLEEITSVPKMFSLLLIQL